MMGPSARAASAPPESSAAGAPSAVELALRHPGAVLILAHGAICDQGILTTRLAKHPGVLYDISCFFPLDVIELFEDVGSASLDAGNSPNCVASICR